VRGANDDDADEEIEESVFEDDIFEVETAADAVVVELKASAPRKRTRRPRDTKRWNRAAVREALNA
jgi:flagellar protein FliO/FliZ